MARLRPREPHHELHRHRATVRARHRRPREHRVHTGPRHPAAARHQPRIERDTVLTDEPHALRAVAVDDAPTCARVRGKWRERSGTRARARERVWPRARARARRPGSSEAGPVAAVARRSARPRSWATARPTAVRPRPTRSSPPASTASSNGTEAVERVLRPSVSSAPRRQYGAAVSDQPNLHDWGPLVDDLAERREKALGMGGPELRRAAALARQADRARAPRPAARSRHVGRVRAARRPHGPGSRRPATSRPTACVTGVGEIDGRRVAVVRLRLHGDGRLDGRGRREQDRAACASSRCASASRSCGCSTPPARASSRRRARRSPGPGALFREQVAMSGVVPKVAAMLGHCAAGTAYIPALADFVPMVKGTSSMALGGRHLVKAAVGEDVTEEEMGGSAVHTKICGVADLEVADDAECLAIVRALPVVLPAAQPASRRRCAESTDPVDRRCEELYDIVPDRAPARVRHAQGRQARSSTTATCFGMKPEWAKNLVTGLGAGRRSAGRHRREPADGARRRARRERGRQGGAVRVAVRRVQHPARVPARRARLHRRLRGREAGHHPPRRQDAVRGVARRRCRRSVDRPAQELRRRLLRDERTRVRGRLHRRLADRRDRGDGPRRRGQHHPCASSSKRSPRTRSATREAARAGRGDPREHRSVHRGRPRAARRRDRPGRDARRDLAGPAGLAPTSASSARGASTACCPCRPVQALARAGCARPRAASR